MRYELEKTAVRLFVCVLVGATAGCDDFLTYNDPNVVDTKEIDPIADARTLALSAQQDYVVALPRFIVEGSFLQGETFTANINAPENLVAARNVDNTLGLLAGTLFGPISRARASSDRVLTAFSGIEGEDRSIHVARAALFAGYSFVLMAEYFCRGVVDGGAALSTDMMLDSAVHRLTRAVEVGTENGSQEALELANAARVGRARARLFKGENDAAIADAETVPEGFSFSLKYVDDIGNRGRVSNWVATRTFSQTTISVAPAFRELDDPRIQVTPPSEHNLVPMDGETEIWAQAKYPGFGAQIRMASKLEADYISAEAMGKDAMLARIEERRAANGMPAYDGDEDEESVRREFLWQKTLDLYLEGQRMGDFRRHEDALLHVPEPGTPYRKTGYDPIGDTSCFPLPISEITNNPNL